MARSQTVRSSTLINPDELKRPASQHLNSFNSVPNLTRRNSVNAKPLLDFEDDRTRDAIQSLPLQFAALKTQSPGAQDVNVTWGDL